jgi:hypothetical protein
MPEVFRRIGRDLRQLRNIDAYAIAVLVFVFAVLSMAGDILPDNARWAVLLIGVGVLVFRVTLPDNYEGSADDVLKDRTAFEDRPLSARLREASGLWVFAPSAINLLPTELRYHPHHHPGQARRHCACGHPGPGRGNSRAVRHPAA